MASTEAERASVRVAFVLLAEVLILLEEKGKER
jgi:hypothetical protein